MKAVLSVVLALAFAAVVRAAPASPAHPREARLGTDVVPVAYDLTLAPDVSALRSAGEETLDVAVRRPVDAIALNARRIDVEAAALDGAPARAEAVPAIEQLLIRSDKPLAPGRHRITLRFTSRIQDGSEPDGLFRSAGPHGAMLTTLFEPSRARALFPCFDEPAFRAPVALHVRAPSDWTVVSNMPLLEKRTSADGLAQSDFAPTPPISAYMLTLDAGVMTHVDGVAANVPIRVFAMPGQEERARTMLADAERLLPFYASFFGTPFPLPKLDLVVAPGALQSAFEGWGAITFYTEAVPFGTREAGAAGRRGAVEVLAHEMAHQWTGDLVTMRWWSDTFVAEGLAQFAQRASVRDVFPELESWRDDDADVDAMMSNPITAQSKPAITRIRTDLNDDDWQAFNQAAYDKGASVVEGWRLAIGEAAFRARLRSYLHAFAYRSATSEDFWNAMGGRRGVVYGSGWLARRGYPIVDVRAGCERGDTLVRFAQTPYTAEERIDAAYRAQRWTVPLTLRAGTRTRSVVFSGDGGTLRIPRCERVVMSPETRPYYVVRFGDGVYGKAAPSGGTSERERSRDLRDAERLHAAGALADAPYLRLIRGAREPLEPGAWSGLAFEYARMFRLVRGAPEARPLVAMGRDALLPFVRRYATVRSTEREPSRIGYAAAWALSEAGDPEIGAQFVDDYAAILAGHPPNFEAYDTTAVFAAAAATAADVDATEAALRARTDSPVVSVQTYYLTNLGDEALARRILDDVARDPRLLGGSSRLWFTLAVGARHPRLGYAYLRAHVRDLAREIPPTQQAWNVATGAADAVWPAVTPRELEAFLRSAFPRDPAAVREASTRIERHWAQRRSLIAALRALGG